MLNPPTVPYSTTMLFSMRQQLAKPIIREQFSPTLANDMAIDFQPQPYNFASNGNSLLVSPTSSNLETNASGYKTGNVKVKKASISADRNSFVNRNMVFIVGGVVLIIAVIVYHHLQEKKQNEE
jgi:hypothetical protein